MLNIMITGVGGQGTVLAAKLLAQAAETRNWRVRTAETIGMAQRGGSVVSHVRLANQDEPRIDAPLSPTARPTSSLHLSPPRPCAAWAIYVPAAPW